MSAPLTIAAVQCAPVFDEIATTSTHILACATDAAAAGARLILFPEAYLQGHGYEAEMIAQRALPLDHPTILDLARRLASLPIIAVIGLFEQHDGSLYNSAMVIADGRIVGRYAKQDPREGGCTPGTERPVFACDDWPFAISICRDTRSAGLALDLAGRGAKLLCYPLGNLLPNEAAEAWRGKHAPIHAQRARETGCWVLTSDVMGTAGDWTAHGNTRLFNPAGAIVAEVPDGQPGMIVATIR